MVDLPLKKFNKFYFHLKAFAMIIKRAWILYFYFASVRVFLNNLYSFSMKSRAQSFLVIISCSKENIPVS